jgi:hypothetical protein
MRKRIISLVGAALLLGSFGAGVASADPINDNSRYLSVVCNGELLNLVTNQGTNAHVLGDSRVVVMKGITIDGVWLYQVNNGWDDKDIVVCPYVEHFGGHTFVLYATIN